MNDNGDNETQTSVAGDSMERNKYKPLRIWPAVLLLLAMLAAKLLPKFAEDETMALLMATILGPLILGVLIMVWWLAFSRATFKERLIGLLGVVGAAVLTFFVMDPSMQGPGFILIGAPLATAAFGIVTVFLGRVLSIKRTVIAILAATLGFGFITLLRNDGMWADGQLGLNWRWIESPEELMLAAREASPNTTSEFDQEQLGIWVDQPEWTQFRGPDANSSALCSPISTDWSSIKPELIWKTAVGPGWSSFVIAGNLLFTQEQRGEQETVVCYAADSGKEIWSQQINERFFDPLGGPGPRATPTLSDGMLFVQSANGVVQRLDPTNGDLIWSKDIKTVVDREPPTWGFAASPLVVGNKVIVHAGGADDNGVLAFDVETGELLWSGKAGDHSYSTPQLARFSDRDCVLMLTNTGLNILDPETGSQMLDYQWNHSGYRAVQPQVVGVDSILLPTQEIGTRRIKISRASSSSTDEVTFDAKEQWTSKQLKPDFNDFVVFENNAYGFDGRIFTCINLETGQRQWKGGRYGKGQVLLLDLQGVLLVVSESGEVVLVKASPDGHQELAKFQALEGRTWNHPVVFNNLLFIRNSQEAACYELPAK